MIIDHGNTLAMSAPLMVPAERLAVDKQGRVMLLGLTSEDFAALPQLSPDAGQPVKVGETIRVSQAQ